MEEKLLGLFEQEFPDIDFTVSDTLVDDGILDSLTLTEILGTIAMEFGINIPYEEITEDNFNSVSAMAALVSRIMDN